MDIKREERKPPPSVAAQKATSLTQSPGSTAGSSMPIPGMGAMGGAAGLGGRSVGVLTITMLRHPLSWVQSIRRRFYASSERLTRDKRKPKGLKALKSENGEKGRPAIDRTSPPALAALAGDGRKAGRPGDDDRGSATRAGACEGGEQDCVKLTLSQPSDSDRDSDRDRDRDPSQSSDMAGGLTLAKEGHGGDEVTDMSLEEEKEREMAHWIHSRHWLWETQTRMLNGNFTAFKGEVRRSNPL